MDLPETLVAVERELIDTRRAAVRVIFDLMDTVIATDDGRERLARRLDELSRTGDQATARLARLVAAALRSGTACGGLPCD